jgi:hypothetical protein
MCSPDGLAPQRMVSIDGDVIGTYVSSILARSAS